MIIGVDIGGTKVAAGLVDSTGEITHKARVPMIPAGDAATGFAAVVNAVEAIFSAVPEARGAAQSVPLISHAGAAGTRGSQLVWFGRTGLCGLAGHAGVV